MNGVYVEIKLDEIYGSMATSSEIKKLHQEVAKSLWYTGLSRARSALVVLVHDDEPDGRDIDEILDALLAGGATGSLGDTAAT